MQLTKYPQSCLKLEKDGRAVMVDVGTLATAEYSVADFGRCEAALFTHRHADHLDVDAIDDLVDAGMTLYGNQDVADAVGGDRVQVFGDGEQLEVAGFAVKTFRMDHCLMVNGSEGVPNTGLLIDDDLLLPGDSTEDVGITADKVALPIFGPDISPHDAFELATALRAKTLIPVHYDVAGMNPEVFVRLGGKYDDDVEVEIVQNGSTISL